MESSPSKRRWAQLPFALLFLGLTLAVAACRSEADVQPTPTSVVSGSVQQELRLGQRRVQVDRVVWVDFLTYEERTAAASGRYLILVLSLANDASRQEHVSLADFLVVDSRGQLYAPATNHHLVQGFNPSVAAASILSLSPYTEGIASYAKTHTALAFDVPRDSQDFSLSLYGGAGIVTLE